MNISTFKVRLMKSDDFDAVVKIDKRILKTPRLEYYKYKFDKFFLSRDYIPTSLVAEDENGTVVGFIMGELYMGEFGIFQDTATLDTIGVDPEHQRKGIGKLLLNEFIDHLKSLDVEKIGTLVNINDSRLMPFLNTNQFSPSKTISLERYI
jgi:ribosomal protein S18 acetylase RimI-like enzyme